MLIGQVRGIRVLCEVAEHGSFSAAAARLGLTQSAVSQHVAGARAARPGCHSSSGAPARWR